MWRRFKVAALYTGGLLGPLGGGIVAPMLPQVGRSVHASTSAVATSLTAYFVPFAVLQLVSGTLGERWGRRRTVLVAYLVYAVAPLVWLPVYHAAPSRAFGAAGVSLLLAAPVLRSAENPGGCPGHSTGSGSTSCRA